MHRSRVVVLLLVLLSLHAWAQQRGGGRGGSSNLSEEERAARRAEFESMTPEEREARMSEMRAQREATTADATSSAGAAVSSTQDGVGDGVTTTAQAAETGSEVTVNWENVTLKDCIEVLCRDLKMEFVISPSVNVSQEVSVRAGDVTKWTTADKTELFDAILETAGVQKVQRGRIWVFSPSDIRPVVEAYTDTKYGDGKPVIGVIKLDNIDATTAEPFLNTVGGKPTKVFAMKGSRMVLVLGTQQFLTQMETLVTLIDVPSSILRPYALEFASSDELTEELTSIFAGQIGVDGEALRFTSVARLNTVIAHNVPESLTDDVAKWVKLLDREDSMNGRVTRVYRLQVIDAETIGTTLDSLYSSLYKQAQSATSSSASTAKTAKTSTSGNTQDSSKKSSGKNGAGAGAAATPTASVSAKSASSSSDEGTPDMEEEAVILADADTNTLIVNATPEQHRDLAKTISELDRPRRQVLIETVLCEVTLDEETDLGVEWSVSKGLSSAGVQSGISSLLSDEFSDLSTDGLSYLIQSSEEKWAFIQAAQADSRLQILSSPTVLTRDGMEAVVSFGEEVPIQEKSTSSSDTDSYSYTYEDAMISLTVTPVIDDNRMVTLDLVQSERRVPADYTIETSGDDDDIVLPPIFTTREISSSLQVYDGQTLILGGLIQRKDQKEQSGIPLLCKIPLIGWLFGSTQTVKVGSEILMILTPHVVDTRDETDLLTREFREKIIGSMSEKDVRTLYGLNLKDAEKPASTKKAAKVEKEAEAENVVETENVADVVNDAEGN
jgi:general secretion pathway protein D